MNCNFAHLEKRLEQQKRIPVVRVDIRFRTGIGHDADGEYVDEAAALTEQRQPEALERRLLVEQLPFINAPRNVDPFHVAHAAV